MLKIKMKMGLIGLISFAVFTSCTQSNSSEKKDERSGAIDTNELAVKKQKLLTFLSDIKSNHILGGIHNREPNSDPAKWTNEIHKLTGEYPALWSADFLFQKENIDHRGTMIDEAIKQFQNGAVVNIMWHACNPAYGQPCEWDNGKGVLSSLSDDQWKQLFVEGSEINTQFMQRVDEIAVYLQKLQENKVVVLFRTFHEMNQGKFWWGGRPGLEGTAKLYRKIHDYLEHEKGLHNLIWVWNIQDFPTLDKDVDEYNPGSDYWDIVSLDVYDDATGFSNEKYESIKRIANGKPMGIGECQKLPSVEVLNQQKDWIFFMGWSELVFEHNSEETIKEIFGSDRVYMLGDLNNLKSGI